MHKISQNIIQHYTPTKQPKSFFNEIFCIFVSLGLPAWGW